MRKFWLYFLFILLGVNISFSQSTIDKYWIKFIDKSNNNYSLERPEEFLSARSLERRSRQNIEITEQDLPVSQLYLDSLKSIGIKVLNTSKWFNSAVVKSEDLVLPDAFESLSFIIEYQKVFSEISLKSKIEKFNSTISKGQVTNNSLYGMGYEQISLSQGNFLHELGYRGEGIMIAVLDAGFYNANYLPAFDSLWANSQILGHRNFVDDQQNIFESHPHGMYVLSIMGGNIPGQLVGTAPDASFWLLRSEDTSSEFLIEEDNWVAAAEFADSIGADIINSSLGYYEFDDPEMNHSYADMDGKSTRVSIGANIASSKGILVVASAGNEGNDPWHYIIAPSDAEGVLSIGAVDSLDNKAEFSSFGPSSDGRIKPDVTSMGKADAFQGTNGYVVRGNGTSFSSPVLAGLAACLWQGFPQASNFDIAEAIIKSARYYSSPDASVGHGTANFLLAYQHLKVLYSSNFHNEASLFPNPVDDYFTIIVPNDPNSGIEMRLFNSAGQLVRQDSFKSTDQEIFITTTSGLSNLNSGTYILKIFTGNETYTKKIIKL
ncbi:MAG: S8 family serine peptidase [Bacteroidales bacterium]|nr:S8 family serine peptidase [Bacteroidales bacterium]